MENKKDTKKEMKVIKRNGKKVGVNFNKIRDRIKKQTYGLDSKYIDAIEVSQKVINGLHDDITTVSLDNLAAETAAAMVKDHPDYSILAARIAITALHKETSKSFVETMEIAYNNISPVTGKPAPLISKETLDLVHKYGDELDAAIDYNRDTLIDFFGFKTLERSYLFKEQGKKIIERPQHMWMRVALGIWKDNIKNVLKLYDFMSTKRYTHATPTLFNSGTNHPQLSSCFLLNNKEDSLEGIFGTLTDAARISKWSGGIGLALHNVRGTGAYIGGTGGFSDGLLPLLRHYNTLARYINQGGKRKGSFAVYLEPWHIDFPEFLDIRLNHGKEELRARDLFTAVWTNDLFMERYNNNEEWTLFSPDEAVGLDEVYGKEFEELYLKYEAEGLGRKKVKARDLYAQIQTSQMETGTPYMLYKDACNIKSNQKNIGTIKSSNLCAEILEYTDSLEEAVCNLASLALATFIKDGKYDFKKLHETAYFATESLNQVIDVNFYPTEETKRSNMRHRPIGLGVQGLADVFAILKIPFDSDEAKKLNKQIFETIYHASLSASCDQAKLFGAYETFEGSPASQGILQYDMWEERSVGTVKTEDGKSKWAITDSRPIELSGMWDFDKLKEDIKNHGLRNSLNIALMPTASTSQILGFNECFEPFTSNIYSRGTLSGDFVVVNKYLVYDLIELGLWSAEMRDEIILNDGSVQNIEVIPSEIRERYKTVWEIKMKDVIDMSADRGAFVCQTQSMNLFIPKINNAKLSSAHIYGWMKGLKTGMYYLRTLKEAQALKGLGGVSKKAEPKKTIEEISCSLDDPDSCLACGS